MRTTLSNILTGLFAAMFVAGVGLLVGVWAAPQWDAYQAEMQVSSMRAEASSSSSTVEGAAQLSEARSYNSALAGESSGSTTPYGQQLNLIDAAAIGWLEIPSIDLKRPVYHYDSDEVLMAGLGHVEGTSLPVGGESTHCCVTGHSGMLGSRMFDDLDKLRVGDVFVFWTLGDPYAYRVYDIEVVLPDMTSSLYIQKGRDLATLITCTPYGVNSHRLLVHGERTGYVPGEIAAAEHRPTSDRLWVLVAGIAAVAVGVGVLLYLLLGNRTLALAAISVASGETVWTAAGMGVADSVDGMKVQLKPFGRAELRAAGIGYKASWSRVADDIVIDLHESVSTEALPIPGGGVAEVGLPSELRLEKSPDGSFSAVVQVNDALEHLVFRK